MMKFNKGDVVHTVDKDLDNFNIIGVVVDANHKDRWYKVLVRVGDKDDVLYYDECEVF